MTIQLKFNSNNSNILQTIHTDGDFGVCYKFLFDTLKYVFKNNDFLKIIINPDMIKRFIVKKLLTYNNLKIHSEN